HGADAVSRRAAAAGAGPHRRRALLPHVLPRDDARPDGRHAPHLRLGRRPAHPRNRSADAELARRASAGPVRPQRLQPRPVRSDRGKARGDLRRVPRHLRHRIGGHTVNPMDCYHTGLVVDDMAAAAERLTTAMGYQWTKPVEATLSVTTAGGDVEVPFRFIYSVNAPHLELIQEVPGTIWTAPTGGAAHHLG